VGQIGLPEPKVKLDFCGISKNVVLDGYDGNSRVALNEIVSFFLIWGCCATIVVDELFARVEFDSGLVEFTVLLDAGKYGGALALKIVAPSPGLHNSEVIFLEASFMTFKNVLLPGFSAIFF
jgi:hypothetical protein